MNLLIEYFRPPNIRRHSEYVYALHENIANSCIERVIVFAQPEDEPSFRSEKVEIVVRKSRPTFGQLFEFCNKNLQDKKCIVANADIIFDETLQIPASMNLGQKFLALSRWELGESHDDVELFESSVSQDCWIFQTPIPVQPTLDFYLGQPGCDNRIARILNDLGYQVSNPSKRIVTKHFHASEFRTYSSAEAVPGPYLAAPPTDLEHMQTHSQVFAFDGFDQQGNAYVLDTAPDSVASH